MQTSSERAAASRVDRSLSDPIIVLPCADPLAARIALDLGAEAGWVGSLELSSLCGVPDRYVLHSGDVVSAVLRIQKATKCRLPLLVDIDAGYGGPASLADAAMGLSIVGATMLVMENKRSEIDKCNTMALAGDDPSALLEAGEFSERITVAREAAASVGKAKVCARFEDLAVGRSEGDLMRSVDRVMAVRPDALFLSCKDATPESLLSVLRQCRQAYPETILLTTCGRYDEPPEADVLFDAGLNVLILSHQSVRCRAGSLEDVFRDLLAGRWREVESRLPSVDDVLSM